MKAPKNTTDKTRLIKDTKREDIARLVEEVPVLVFAELDNMLNKKGLSLMVVTYPDVPMAWHYRHEDGRTVFLTQDKQHFSFAEQRGLWIETPLYTRGWLTLPSL